MGTGLVLLLASYTIPCEDRGDCLVQNNSSAPAVVALLSLFKACLDGMHEEWEEMHLFWGHGQTCECKPQLSCLYCPVFLTWDSPSAP